MKLGQRLRPGTKGTTRVLVLHIDMAVGTELHPCTAVLCPRVTTVEGLNAPQHRQGAGQGKPRRHWGQSGPAPQARLLACHRE